MTAILELYFGFSFGHICDVIVQHVILRRLIKFHSNRTIHFGDMAFQVCGNRAINLLPVSRLVTSYI